MTAQKLDKGVKGSLYSMWTVSSRTSNRGHSIRALHTNRNSTGRRAQRDADVPETCGKRAQGREGCLIHTLCRSLVVGFGDKIDEGYSGCYGQPRMPRLKTSMLSITPVS